MHEFINRFENYIIKSVSSQNRHVMVCYLDFIKLGLKSVQNEKISQDIKIKKFDLLYRQIFKNCCLKNNLIAKLQSAFIAENISLSVMSDMIKAFKHMVLNQDNENWNAKVYLNQLFVSPLVRMIMVLNDLNYSVYMPFASLTMSAIFVSDMIEKKMKHRRFYLSKIKGFLKDGKVLPLVITDKVFRFKIWYFVIFLEKIINKIEEKKEVCLSKFDLITILFYASFKWLFTRVRRLKIKGV